MLRGALENIFTFKFDNRLIQSKNHKVKLILLGVKFVMLNIISKTKTTRKGMQAI